MTHYYFDMRNNDEEYLDTFGDDFVTVEAAEVQALLLVLDIAADQLHHAMRYTTTCRIRNEDGLIIYEAMMIAQGKRFLCPVNPASLDALSIAADDFTIQPSVENRSG